MHEPYSGADLERRYYLKHGAGLVHLNAGWKESRVLLTLETTDVRKVAGSLEDASPIFTGERFEPTRICAATMECDCQIPTTMRWSGSTQFFQPIPYISPSRLGPNEHDHQKKNANAKTSQHDAPLHSSVQLFVQFNQITESLAISVRFH